MSNLLFGILFLPLSRAIYAQEYPTLDNQKIDGYKNVWQLSYVMEADQQKTVKGQVKE